VEEPEDIMTSSNIEEEVERIEEAATVGTSTISQIEELVQIIIMK
jgi:hypothetical protein